MDNYSGSSLKIDIIGRGNVGSHLFKALSHLDNIDVVSVDSRMLDGVRRCNVYLLTVKDAAIPEVAENLKTAMLRRGINPDDAIVAHTSGSTPADVLEKHFPHCGILYPMQTFTKDKVLAYSSIPFYIVAGEQAVADSLHDVACAISGSVNHISGNQLPALHLASVLCCNFTNHLWSLASLWLERNGIRFSAMLPLIRETCGKIDTVLPYDAQTGPAVRGDMSTIGRHLNMLDNAGLSNMAEIYNMLSMSIVQTYHNDPNNLNQ